MQLSYILIFWFFPLLKKGVRPVIRRVIWTKLIRPMVLITIPNDSSFPTPTTHSLLHPCLFSPLLTFDSLYYFYVCHDIRSYKTSTYMINAIS